MTTPTVSVTVIFRSRLTPVGLRQLGELFVSIGRRTKHQAAGSTITSLGTSLLRAMQHPTREQRQMVAQPIER
jgi:hypothetical protein